MSYIVVNSGWSINPISSSLLNLHKSNTDYINAAKYCNSNDIIIGYDKYVEYIKEDTRDRSLRRTFKIFYNKPKMNIETIDYHGSLPNLHVEKKKKYCNNVILPTSLPITKSPKQWSNFCKKLSEHYTKFKTEKYFT